MILRSSWVYGIGQDFLNTVLSAVKDPSVNELTVSEYEYACPTSASELARIIDISLKMSVLGIYHAVCHGLIAAVLNMPGLFLNMPMQQTS